MMSINSTLNDDCLLQIFTGLSLPDLLLFRAVCSRWNILLEYTIYFHRRSLQIFGSTDDVAEFRRSVVGRYSLARRVDDHILVATKNFPAACGLLPEILPKITELTICYYYSILEVPPKSLSSLGIHRILANWPALVSLTISRLPESAEIQSALWTQLDHLSSLRELHLFHVYECKNIPVFRALSNLKNFSLTGYSGDIVPILASLSSELTELRLDYVQLTAEVLADILAKNPKFGHQLKHLSLGHNFSSIQEYENRVIEMRMLFRIAGEQFKQISNLQISLPSDTPLSILTASLSRLHHLSVLHLEANLSQLDAEVNATFHLSPLTTLRHLHLSIFGYPTENSFALLPLLAPNLEEIDIKFHYRILPDGLLQPYLNEKSLPRLRKVTSRRYDAER